MRTLLCFLLLTPWPGTVLLAQPDPDCYPELRREGLALRAQGLYAEAVNKFWAARDCYSLPAGHDLDQLIRATQTRQVQELERLIAQAETAEKQARDARIRAESNERTAIEAQRQAEESEARARRYGRRAEARRLAQRADVLRERGELRDALLLAFLATQIGDSSTLRDTRGALARVTRDSFGQLIPTLGAITELQVTKGDTNNLLVLDEGGLTAFRLPEAKVVMTQPEASKLLYADANSLLLAGQEGQLHYHGWNQAEAVATTAGSLGIITGQILAGGNAVLATTRDHRIQHWSLIDGAMQPIARHDGNVYQLRSSPDGSRLASRSSDGTVRLWTATGEPIATLAEADAYLHDMLFSEDGKTVYTASAHGWIDAWRTDGTHLGRSTHGTAPVVQLTPLRDRLLSRALDSCLQLWSASGAHLATLPHGGRVRGMLPWGADQLLSWADDHLIRLWTADGDLLRTFAGHRGRVTGVSVDEAAGLILSTSRDGTARLWDVAGHELASWPLGGTYNPPARLCPATRQLFVVAGNGKELRRWPYPDQLQRQLETDLELLGPDIQRVQTTYDIFYWPPEDIRQEN